MWSLPRRVAVLPCFCLLACRLAPAQNCPQTWTEFGAHGGTFGLAEFDDGSGPAIYFAGGRHITNNGVGHFGRISGNRSETLPSMPSLLSATVFRIRVIDLAGVSHLIACSTQGVFRWDGAAWMRLAAGVGPAFDCCIFDDGSGPALYTCSNQVQRWNGFTSRTTIATTNTNCIDCALQAWDDGSGSALYYTGLFRHVSQVNDANGIARWRAGAWERVGSGFSSPPNWPGPSCTAGGTTMTVFDDGSGEALYVGGFFDHAGGVPAQGIARWDGTEWSSVGGAFEPAPYAYVVDARVGDLGDGPRLIVGGLFTHIAGEPASGLAEWDGAQWRGIAGLRFSRIDPPNFVGDVTAILPVVRPSGPALIVGGSFSGAGNADGMGPAELGCRCPDLDGNNQVDLSDLALLLSNFGRSGEALQDLGDVDGDGQIDIGDLGTLLSSIGRLCS